MTVKIDCAYDQLVEVEKLVPHPRNNNRHSIEQIEALSKLIKAHGFRHALVVSNRSGFIVAGHGRLEAARKLGIEKLPVDFQDFSSEAEEYQCLTADNEIARWAELDYQNIYDTLKELPNIDVSLLGISNLYENELDIDSELEVEGLDAEKNVSDGVKKAIQIEFELQDYDEAKKVINHFRKKGAYIGGVIIDLLKANIHG